MKKRLLSIILALVMVLSMAPVAAYAEDTSVSTEEGTSENTKISNSACTVIGTSESFECDIYYYNIGSASKIVEFTDLADLTDGMTISGLLTTGYVDSTNVANLNSGFALSYDDLEDNYGDDLDADKTEGLSFTNIYGLFVMDSNYDCYIYIIQADVDDTPIEEGTFNVYTGSYELTQITKTEGAYNYYDYMASKTVSVNLYNVTIPYGTKEVTIKTDKESLFYNYDGEGNYLAGWVDDYTKGSTEVTVKVDAPDSTGKPDGVLDYIQVQNPYNKDYSGGELRYAITFTMEEPIEEGTFTAYAGETALTQITKTDAGYTYIEYGGKPDNVSLYTITIPYGTTEVTLKLSKESLVYNYDGEGNYLAGWVDDYTKGSTEVTVKVDAADSTGKSDGVLDYIQVQNPYNEDYSGGELRYAITFVMEEAPTVVTPTPTPAASTTCKTHSYGSWKTVKAATALAKGSKKRVCKVCGKTETKAIAKLKATIKLSATKKTIKRKKSYTLKISKLAKGDAVKSVKSSKTKIATVKKIKKNQYKITAKKKKGTANITVTLKSGKKATLKLKVK